MTDPRQTLTPRNIAEEISGSLCLSTSKVAELLAENGISITLTVTEGERCDFDALGDESIEVQCATVNFSKGAKIFHYRGHDTANDVAQTVKDIIEDA